MTSIERLQISGIRSFNPDPSHAQTVHFQKPLTVILGKNGAGKTTIIEALLNACTGAMPPGSGGSEKSSFVYDPKVIGESEVKAQIRLIFSGKDGRNMQVIRSVQVTRTRAKTELKTLDNTIACQDPTTGRVVSSTYKASDVDRVVPELLGVSPSVLKYVVFCHQEESNWPLSAPKEVKEIFDDLFAATRYVTTLEKLRAVGKETKKNLKDFESELFNLRELRNQAKELEEGIAVKEEHVKTMEARKTEREPELRELRKASASLDAVEQQADALAREAAQIAGRMDQKRDTIQQAGLPPSNHTLEQAWELKDTLVAHAKKAETTVAQKTKLVEAATRTLRQREQEQFSSRAQVESLSREEQQHKRNVWELRELLKSMPELLRANEDGDGADCMLGDDSVDERSLKRLMDSAEAAVTQARAEAQQTSQHYADKVAKEEERRHEVLRAMDADKKEVEMTEAMLSSLTRQMSEARAALQSLGGSDGGGAGGGGGGGGDSCHEKLSRARRDVEALRKRVEAAEEVRKKGAHAQRRQRITEEFDQQSTVVARLRQAMSRARLRAGHEGDVDRLRTRIEEQQGTLEDRLREHVIPELQSLHIRADVDGDFTATVLQTEDARRRKEGELRQLREAHSALDRQTAALEQRRANLADQLAQHQTEDAAKCAVYAEMLHALAQEQGDGGGSSGSDGDTAAAATSLDRYEELLHEARAAADQSVQKRHTLEALATCYGDFVAAAEASNTCAVCERPFADDDERQRFTRKAETRQWASPEALEAAQLEAARSRDRVQRLEAMQKAVQDVRRLRAQMPRLEEEHAEVEAQLERLSAERNAGMERLDRAADALTRLTDVVYRLQSLKDLAAEVATLKTQLAARERQIADEHAKRAGGDSAGHTPPPEEYEGKSYDELTGEYETATARLLKLHEQLAELRRMEEGGDGAHAAERELLEKQHTMYQLELAATKVGDLERTLSRLEGEAQSGRAALQALQARRREQDRQLEETARDLRKLTEERKAAEESQRRVVTAAEARFRALENATPQTLSYIKAGKSRQLQTARDSLKAVESVVQQSTQEVDALAQEIHAAREVLADHTRRMAEVERIITVLELRKSLEDDQARLADVNASLEDLKGAKLCNVEQILGAAAKSEPLPRLRELLRGKIGELERAQAQQQGSVEAVLQEVHHLKAKLSQSKYANIEKRYRSTFVKAQSEALSMKDLDNYYVALEVGVQAYHKEKISQINHIIGELWRQTYRGSDIDAIEIRSETEATSSTASKRSYTYRVVIKRGDSELDMRGRCSAGQKVLASIVIRLALSEAFCFDCGILALDEPTTNLDEDNARSLAESLRSLIELKRNVRNFQLIVITHDEQFVRALGGHHLEHFHYVHKDREGAYSIVEKRTFAQLFA